LGLHVLGMATVQFQIHATLKSAIQRVSQFSEGRFSDCLALEKISYSEVCELSKLYRQHLPADTVDNTCGRGWVHELLRGATLYKEPEKSTKTPEFKAFLEQQKRKMDEREYQQSVADLSFNKPKDETVKSSLGDSGSTAIAFGLNVIVLMATGFFFFYCIARILGYTGATPIISGALGLVLAMILETVLFVVREEGVMKYDDIRIKREQYHEKEDLLEKTQRIAAKQSQPPRPPSSVARRNKQKAEAALTAASAEGGNASSGVGSSETMKGFSKFDFTAEPALPGKS